MRRSLLITADEDAATILSRLLRDLEVDVDHQTDPHSAVQRLVDERYDSIIVDAEDKAAAELVLRTVKQLPSNQRGLPVVLAQSENAVYLGFSLGAALALYKPVTVERVALGLRAIRNLISRERRRGAERIPVHVPASVGGSGASGARVTIVDLSNSGAAIQGRQHLPNSGLFTLHCKLPDTTTPVMFTAEVIWQDSQGRSGIRFVNVALASRQILNQWLKANTPRENGQTKAKTAGSKQ